MVSYCITGENSKTKMRCELDSAMVRVKYFGAYVNIFLHPCGIWKLTKKKGKCINDFQNNSLRRMVACRMLERPDVRTPVC